MLKKLLLLVASLAALCAAILVVWYQIDGIPTKASEDYLTSDSYKVVDEEDGGFLFIPKAPNGAGVVIMHGALIHPQSYTKTAAYFANLGYTVMLPLGGARLSIAAAADTARRMRESPLRDWYIIGHSMGGMATLETISTHGGEAKAVALWASGIPQSYTHLELPILFIWGDTDGLLPEDRFRTGQANLPKHVEYVTLEGANHKNFALYSHQFFDREATIDWMDQIDFANETTARFFDRYRQ